MSVRSSKRMRTEKSEKPTKTVEEDEKEDEDEEEESGPAPPVLENMSNGITIKEEDDDTNLFSISSMLTQQQQKNVFAGRFIQMVKENRVLYDPTHPDFPNFKIKQRIWDDIGATFNSSGDTMKKKWKNLKDSYSKHLKATEPGCRYIPKSIFRYRSWPWVEEMEFFKPFFQQASNQNKSDPEKYMMVMFDENTDGAVKLDLDESESECSRVEKHHNDTPVLGSDCDEIDLICSGYARTIKKFSKKRQCITKFRIAQVLMEEELKHLEELENR